MANAVAAEVDIVEAEDELGIVVGDCIERIKFSRNGLFGSKEIGNLDILAFARALGDKIDPLEHIQR